jgi:hypothetical protein
MTRADRALVATYHEAKLADLIEHVRDGLARYDAGELSAFDLDEVIHRFTLAARELWKFCGAIDASNVAEQQWRGVPR